VSLARVQLPVLVACWASGAGAQELVTYSEVTCVFPKEMLGAQLQIRDRDDLICVLNVEHTEKKPASGLGKLFSVGTYMRRKDVPISMSARRLIEYIESDRTDFPKDRLDACFDTMQANMMSQKDIITEGLESQKADTFYLTCAEGSKL
jgi:hypothetical protein